MAEALACGTPVCGFERGAVPELLDERCGRLVTPDDVAELAEAIVTAPTLLFDAARERAVAHCSIDRMVGRYEEIYNELTFRAAA